MFRNTSLALGLLVALASAAATPPVDLSHVPPRVTASPLAPGWQHGAFMEVFVRAYQDSDGDGIGDLRGLIARLDYLQDLGIKGIWLMPIQQSADRDHGYATTDFRAIERDYGALADFDELIREAHKRGIGVITDYVINHSAKEHPLFASAAASRQSPFRDWYVWQGRAPKGWDIWDKDPWTQTPNGAYFGTFGPHMPDFNFLNPKVLAYHEDSLRFWLNRGIDGFRLDAVPHLVERDAVEWNDQPESRKLTRELTQLVHRYPGRHVVCEATANPKVYGLPQVCGSAFAFNLESNIVKAVKSGGADEAALRFVADYFVAAPGGMATMISNHDHFAGARLWDQVKGDQRQYRLAAASYLLLPGTPYIYYGEEIGQAGADAPADPDHPLRSPMSWSAGPNAGFAREGIKPFRPIAPNAASHNAEAQRRDPDSLFNFYKSMIGLRNRLPSIAQGSYERPFVAGQAIGFQRRLGDEQSLVLINYGTTPAALSVPALGAGKPLQAAYPAGAAPLAVGADGNAAITLAPQSVQVFVRGSESVPGQ
ncbi:alpha-amylase family glycosyl hydrolase [Rivibacter subsaxonicus]|uniref:Glycosidase n=1 Tax=Rivibacter subsaxonicus TaxID=457575 RepID=A0A4Q7VZ87_9BURK|nr:alpha-amylase family glycosyl hydrolase [Rivibacter subsaxonicus]RZU01993.1 glycosidase [Rivibacter subsaxonicus]